MCDRPKNVIVIPLAFTFHSDISDKLTDLNNCYCYFYFSVTVSLSKDVTLAI